MTISEEKAKIRAWAKDLRVDIDLKITSEKIIEKIIELKEYKFSKNVMSYLGKNTEVSLNNLFGDNNKSWFVPSVFKSSLLVIPYYPGETILKKGAFDIEEPEFEDDNSFDQINKKINLDLIFVPGLCFDKNGNRLGFGKGFYDSFLKLNPNSIKIGICPKKCLLDKLPTDEWDMKMDMIITDH